MERNDPRYQAYVEILKEELIPAMGCTEPIALAYAAAKAREVLGVLPDSVQLQVSGSIIKNVKSVIVPNTGHLKGMEAAVAAGIIAGSAEKELEVISEVSEEKKSAIRDYLQTVPITIEHTEQGHVFDIVVTERCGQDYARVRIADYHTNICRIERNGTVLYEVPLLDETVQENARADRSLLNMQDIWDFAETADLRDVADQIRALNLTGVGFMVDTKRYYPKGDFLTQVLGFTSVDGEGLEGVEAYYNKYLAGTPGELRAQTDVKGNEIAFGEEYYVPATDGYTVSLTIDYVIQSFVEKACADAYAQYNPKGVMCIAMDPNTGEILALCNKQSYDLNSPPRDDTETLNELSRNRILADANDPGSIFKVFTMAAALDTGQTKDSETFTCNGSIKVQNTTIRCTSTHGTVDLKTGLAKSCNPVFVTLALRMGTDTMYDYLKNFGFGSKTGVDMSAEASGIVIPRENVTDNDLARIGFGQSISTTPIQTLNAFCSVINGGELLEPHIMKSVTDADGNVVEESSKVVKANPISKETSDHMREMLEDVVNEGSGKNSYVKGFRVGGKTGTAQKYDETGKVKEGAHLSSFIAFAPANDPKIAILFMVDEADTYNDYGSTVAAPYVGQILEDTLKYMKVEPQLTEEEQKEQQEEEKKVAQVESVMGMSQEDAVATLEKQGYKVTVNGEGVVSSQMLAPGTNLQQGETVVITLTPATPTPIVMTEVPALVGKTKQECEQLLEEAGLTAYFHGTGKKVTWQNKKAGTEVQQGTEIRLELGD